METETILMMYKVVCTIVIGFGLLWFFWKVTKCLDKYTDGSTVKMMKAVLYAFITSCTLYNMIWIEENNTMLNFCIFLVSFFELYSNADEIIFVFTSKLYHFTMDGAEYRVRVKKSKN